MENKETLQCEICSKEFEGKKGSRFCSSSCRVKSHRDKKSPKHIGAVTGKQVNDMVAQDLYDEINAYIGDKWVESIEYAELMSRLRNWSLTRLRNENYVIPQWKLGVPPDLKEFKRKKK